MESLRDTALSTIKAFLRDEWPRSATRFGELAVGNPHFFPRFSAGRGAEIDTADLVLKFIADYRKDPERTMRKAIAESAARAARRKKRAPTVRRRGRAHKARAAA